MTPEAEDARCPRCGGRIKAINTYCAACGYDPLESSAQFFLAQATMRDNGQPALFYDKAKAQLQAALAASTPEAIREGEARLPVMALRPYHDDPERLDDVVVKDVRTFRAEMMSDGTLWMACYFNDEGDGIHFWARAGKRGTAQLHLSATTVPEHTDFDAPTPSEGREDG